MRKYALKINDKKFDLEVKHLSTEDAEIVVNGQTYNVAIDEIITDKPKARAMPATKTKAKKAAPAAAPATGGGGKGLVKAPIPGSILSVYVKEGDSVKQGQPIYKMEAMKMENEITSQVAGTVSKVYIKEGDAVNQGQDLILIA